MADKEIFEFTYSASEQSEVQKIREKYLPKEMTKLDQLRALDESVTKRGSAVSIIHGIICSLLLRLGMSCCMVWTGKWFVPGILLGCIGIAGVLMTYPIYNRLVQEDRDKIAPEIIRLSDELILGNNI